MEIYPALNPMGIDSITRGIPQYDIDMNRAFPGTRDGTFVDSICADIVEDIAGADICIDVHSSNIYLREIPQIRISAPTAETLLPYAKMMNVDFIWVHESQPCWNPPCPQSECQRNKNLGGGNGRRHENNKGILPSAF